MSDDDLVERLRAEGIAELDEAADRIEKLEAALREIVDVKYFGSEGADMESQEMRQIARKALGG